MTNRIIADPVLSDQDAATLALIDASWARWEARRLLPAGYYAVLASLALDTADAPHNVPEAPGALAPAGMVHLPGYGYADATIPLARQWAAADRAVDDLCTEHATRRACMDRAVTAATHAVPPFTPGPGRAEGSR